VQNYTVFIHFEEYNTCSHLHVVQKFNHHVYTPQHGDKRCVNQYMGKQSNSDVLLGY